MTRYVHKVWASLSRNPSAVTLLRYIDALERSSRLERDGLKWAFNTREGICERTQLTRHRYDKAIADLKSDGLVECSYGHAPGFGAARVTFLRLTDAAKVRVEKLLAEHANFSKTGHGAVRKTDTGLSGKRTPYIKTDSKLEGKDSHFVRVGTAVFEPPRPHIATEELMPFSSFPARPKKTPPAPLEPEVHAIGSEPDPDGVYESRPAPVVERAGRKTLNAAYMERVWRDLRIASDPKYFHGTGWDTRTKRDMKLLIAKVGPENTEKLINVILPRWDKFADYVHEAVAVRVGDRPSVLKLLQQASLAVQFAQEYAIASGKASSQKVVPKKGPSLAAYIGGGVKDGSG